MNNSGLACSVIDQSQVLQPNAPALKIYDPDKKTGELTLESIAVLQALFESGDIIDLVKPEDRARFYAWYGSDEY